MKPIDRGWAIAAITVALFAPAPEAASAPVAAAIMPAAKLPVAEAKNQVPMISDAMCFGASRFIALSPTGDRQSSPVVWRR